MARVLGTETEYGISTPMINDAFRWSEENENLQRKAKIVMSYYKGADPE